MKISYERPKPSTRFRELNTGDLFSNETGSGLFMKIAPTRAIVIDPVSSGIPAADDTPWGLDSPIVRIEKLIVIQE